MISLKRRLPKSLSNLNLLLKQEIKSLARTRLNVLCLSQLFEHPCGLSLSKKSYFYRVFKFGASKLRQLDILKWLSVISCTLELIANEEFRFIFENILQIKNIVRYLQWYSDWLISVQISKTDN